MIVTLGDLTVETVPTAAPVKWKLTDLVDWYSSPPIRSDIEDMPQSDGAFDVERSYRGAKIMALEGIVTSSSAELAVVEGYERIAALAPVGERLKLLVDDVTGIQKEMWVRINGQPTVQPFTDRRARFQIPLIAPDGRKYGPETPYEAAPAGGGGGDGLQWPLFAPGYLDFGSFSPSGLIIITNNGKAESWPTFAVRGGIGSGGFEITSDANVVKFTGAVPAGQELILSPYAGGRASLSGADVTGEYLTRSEWPSIGPGQSRQYSFNAIGTADANALLTAYFREAWW